jgi:Tol biopolymer transport system component
LYKEVVVRKFFLSIVLFCLGASFTFGQVTREERGNLVLENIPEIPQSLKDRMLQYRNTRSAAFQGFHPDKGLLITTRFGRTSQVHWVKQPGGARQQLTFFDEPVSEVAVNPDASQRNFIFDKDIGGSEFYQLFLYDLGSGVSTLLTDGESRNGVAVWSNSGDRYAYFSTRRNGRDFDILLASSTEPEKATTILKEGGLWVPADWAPDDSKLLVIRYVSAAEAHPYILDLGSKELTPVRPSEEQIAYRSALC